MNRNFKNKKIIVANWKMGPLTLREAKNIFADLKKRTPRLNKSAPIICPPSIFLSDLSSGYRGGRFSFGSQDISFREEDASTGEVSGAMLKNLGVDFSIIGHSEKRSLGETNQIVAQKIKNAISHRITPILCVGEVERDHMGKYLRFIEQQLRESLALIGEKEISKIIVAYEPVWAIGKGHHAMSGHELHQMNLFIKKILSDIYNRKKAMAVPVLYGGSVDAENVFEITKHGEVDGLLVGRASLNQFVFVDILKKIEEIF